MGPDAMILVFWMLSFKPYTGVHRHTCILHSPRLHSYPRSSEHIAVGMSTSAALPVAGIRPQVLTNNLDTDQTYQHGIPYSMKWLFGSPSSPPTVSHSHSIVQPLHTTWPSHISPGIFMSPVSLLVVVVIWSVSHVQLWDPINFSMPGFSVLHQLSEFAQTHVRWVSDACPLLSFSCLQSFPASGLFQWVGTLHQVAKVLEFQLQHQSFQWIFKVDFL